MWELNSGGKDESRGREEIRTAAKFFRMFLSGETLSPLPQTHGQGESV
jgi:hypothetical protein